MRSKGSFPLQSFPFMRRPFISRYILLYGIICLSGPVFAADGAEELHQKRTLLAKNFVEKLKGKLVRAESPPDMAALPRGGDLALSLIDPGTEMQFRPRVGKYTLDYDVYAIRGLDDFFLSLSDLVTVLNFPIAIDESAQTAQGWFLREDWPFFLDLKSGRGVSRGQEFIVTAQDYQIVDGEMFITGQKLGAWLAMTFDYDVSQQYLNIVSQYPLPIVAQARRREFAGGGPASRNVAVLPRKDYDYDWFSLSAADLSLRTNYARNGESGKMALLNRTDAMLSGQVLKHDAFVGINADDRDGLNALTTRLSRTSDDPELLGPLRARSYVLGDTATVDVPLTGFSPQELGVRVSSNPLSGINFQSTRISGNALPGWDVELYRGNARIDLVTVDSTGRYEFTDVQLFAGDNQFDVLFYGDQGEIRRESINIPLTSELLTLQNNTYDVSVSMTETATYRRQPQDTQDTGTPHVAGQYNFRVGDALSYAGFNAVQESGEQKFYLGSGFTTIWDGFILDTNFAVDEAAEMSGRVGVRKNIADWNLAFSTMLATDAFSPGGNANPVTMDVLGSAQRTYTPPIGVGGNVFLNANYQEYADGATRHGGSIGLGQGFNRVSLSNTLSYDRHTPVAGADTERMVNAFSTRARISNKISVRAGADYQLRPESRMDRYLANVNYRSGPKLNVDLGANHRPETQYSEAELRANYTHEKFRFSPFLRVDSDHDLTAGFNISTSLINTPEDAMPLITGERITGRGIVSGRVFLDKNGNRIFDSGDEPLPGIILESLNSRAREETNAEGYAILKGLSVNFATDIHIDESSLDDPFMISTNRGNSVLPRPGKIFEMDFPIQFAGEIDGTILIDDGETQKLVKFVDAVLLPFDPDVPPILAKAAQDGFYLMPRIPPGRYYLTAAAADAKSLNAARPLPQYLEFSHEGDVVYGHNIILKKGWHDIGFTLLRPADILGWDPSRPAVFLRVPDQASGGILNIVHRLRMKDTLQGVVSGLTPLDLPDAAGDVTRRYTVATLEDGWRRCMILSRRNLPCHVEIMIPSAQPESDIRAQAEQILPESAPDVSALR